MGINTKFTTPFRMHFCGNKMAQDADGRYVFYQEYARHVVALLDAIDMIAPNGELRNIVSENLERKGIFLSKDFP